MHCT